MKSWKSRYEVHKEYVVVCQDCNEDIGRSAQGWNPETLADADELMRSHEEIFHGPQR